jgi:hypothetical protein
MSTAALLSRHLGQQDNTYMFAGPESRLDSWRSLTSLVSSEAWGDASMNTNISCQCLPQTGGCPSSPVSPCGC